MDELARGMRGYGLTVIEGTRVDTFGVEILGVEHDASLPGRDRILVRLSGLGLEETGILAGMSGSPVYIEGRLVGAVAWGYLYAEEPVGLLTPIHEMLTILDHDLTTVPGDHGALPSPDGGGQARVRQGLPVWVSGAGPATSRLLSEFLHPLGLEPLAVPAGRTSAEPLPSPTPGSAIGLQLVGGDLSLTVIGTVTYVDGDRVVAFGHDFFGAGAIDVPFTGVRIFGVLDNLLSSFKLGAATGVLGAARQDRYGAVAGLRSARAAVLPVQVVVETATGTDRFRFEVARQHAYTAGLTQVALLRALESTAKAVGDASLEVAFDLELVDGRRVVHRQAYTGVNAVFAAAVDAGPLLRALTDAPFADVRLQSAQVHVAVRESIHSARIVGARFDRERVQPGDTVTLTVGLAPFRDAERTVEVALRVPEHARGPLLARVGSGRAAFGWQAERLDHAPPASSHELLQRLRRPHRADELVVELLGAQPGLTVAGRELPAPPPSVHRLLTEPHAAGGSYVVAAQVVAAARKPVDLVLHGEHSLTLTVDSKGNR